jgi:hypothetical protein
MVIHTVSKKVHTLMKDKNAKAVPLHAREALEGRGV